MPAEPICTCGNLQDEHVDRQFGCKATVPFGADGEVFCPCARFTARPAPDEQARLPKTGIVRRLGPSTTPVDLIVDSNDYADLRDELTRLRAAHADCSNLSHAEAARIFTEAKDMREERDAALAEAAALRTAFVTHRTATHEFTPSKTACKTCQESDAVLAQTPLTLTYLARGIQRVEGTANAR